MRYLTITRTLAATGVMVLLAACQPADNKATATAKPTVPQTKDQKVAYAIGVLRGKELKTMIEQVQKLGVTMDATLISQGFNDSLNNVASMDDKAVQGSLQSFSKRMNTLAKAAQEKNSRANEMKSKKFLEENAKNKGVVTTASGLQYIIERAGTGPSPTDKDKVEVNYQGNLIDGTEFDSSYKRKKSAKFPVDGVIKGWTEALKLMKKGAKWKLFIPAQLGYGKRKAGKIPPNSTLIFTVELLDVIKVSQDPAPKKAVKK